MRSLWVEGRLRSDGHSRDTFHDKVCSSCGFWLANIGSASTSQHQCVRDAYRKRNCRFKFETSMVSMSMTWISLNPDRARFLSISHPSPPAPMTKILYVLRLVRA